MSELPISNNLRKLRFAQNEMTQAKLAKVVGVTRQTAIALELARYTPTLELALKLATVFNVTVNDVFFGKTKRTQKIYIRAKNDRHKRAIKTTHYFEANKNINFRLFFSISL